MASHFYPVLDNHPGTVLEHKGVPLQSIAWGEGEEEGEGCPLCGYHIRIIVPPKMAAPPDSGYSGSTMGKCSDGPTTTAKKRNVCVKEQDVEHSLLALF